MTAEEHAQSLEALADALGVTRSYHDGTGRLRRACDDALLAVVRALGAPVERVEDAADALHAVRGDSSTGMAPPVATFVFGEGGSVEFPAAGAAAVRGHVTAHLELESGETTSLRVETAPNGGFNLHLPRQTPAGYHHIELDDGKSPRRVSVLVAPARLPEAPRSWGLFAPLYAVRTADRFATYGDLARVAEWMTRDPARSNRHRDTAMLGTLPLLACYFEEPFEPSPYSPISRSFWSELYVDPTACPEFASSVEAGSLHGRGQDAAPASSRHIDYRAAMRTRRREIEALLRTLDAQPSRRRDDLGDLLENDEELANYAAFRAAVERYGTTWERWPLRARSGTLRAGADYDGEAFRYHAYAQWLAREQFADAARRSPAGFYLDLPLGSHGGGYDTWRHSDDYACGVSVGAPPDAVFEGGQNWAFPPLHPHKARAGFHTPLRAALRHHFEHAALLRIDHVMGLHRSFWIPDGFSAADGVYVRYPSAELWSIVAIEAARARGGRSAAVIGEDLGTVPDEVRAEMNDRGALRMHVIPFECRADEAAALGAAPRDALASFGTHDMEPFAAWWESESTPRGPIARFLGCDENPLSVLPALLAWLAASDATVVCANLEDLWLERERQNQPGTASGDSNWQRPFALAFEEFSTGAGRGQVLDALLDVLRGAAPASSPRREHAS